MFPPTRIVIDGLLWCAECRRAVDRGWPHFEGCSLRPENEPDETTLRTIRQRVIADRMQRGGFTKTVQRGES